MPGLKIVWLRETDDLIEGMSLDDEFRQEQQILADRAGTNVIEIACESAGLGTSGLREPRWNRAFRIAAEIVEQLMTSGDVQPTALATSIRELTHPARHHPINSAVSQWLTETQRFADWGISSK